MSNLWSLVINKGGNAFFKQSEMFSPYYELSADYFSNDEYKQQNEIEINSLYRFNNIFSSLFSDGIVNEEWKKHLFNVCMHFILQIEAKSTLTKKEYRIQKLSLAIENGLYGEECEMLFAKLNSIKKHTLLTYLDNQYITGASSVIFTRVLIELLETGIVYKNTLNPNELIVYIGECKNDYYVDILKLVEEFFLPINHTYRVYWDTHFALIGEEQTMKFDKIEIF
jgi:hypothetical protein